MYEFLKGGRGSESIAYLKQLLHSLGTSQKVGNGQGQGTEGRKYTGRTGKAERRERRGKVEGKGRKITYPLCQRHLQADVRPAIKIVRYCRTIFGRTKKLSDKA